MVTGPERPPSEYLSLRWLSQRSGLARATDIEGAQQQQAKQWARSSHATLGPWDLSLGLYNLEGQELRKPITSSIACRDLGGSVARCWAR